MLHNNSYSLPTRVKPSTSEHNIVVQSQLGCDNREKKTSSMVGVHLHTLTCAAAKLKCQIHHTHTHTALARVGARARLKSQTSRTEKNIEYLHHIPQAVPTPHRSAPASGLCALRAERAHHRWCTINLNVLRWWIMSDLREGRAVQSPVGALKPADRDIPKRAEVQSADPRVTVQKCAAFPKVAENNIPPHLYKPCSFIIRSRVAVIDPCPRVDPELPT